MSLYATPRTVTDLGDCYFYHTMEIPGYGVVRGEWDLRRGVDRYLGRVDFARKRVLELGTASGFLCFHMERSGADVVGFDLSDQQSWDAVPFAGLPNHDFVSERREHIRKLNNGFWLGHRAFNSKSRIVYGDIYNIPGEIGPVDICTCCSILLHLRDPFRALEQALRLTQETVIVTEPAALLGLPGPLRSYRRILPTKLSAPPMYFLPDHRTNSPVDTWWRLSPEIVQRFLAVLGFEDSRVTYHYQPYRRGRFNIRLKQFTVVARRTVGT